MKPILRFSEPQSLDQLFQFSGGEHSSESTVEKTAYVIRQGSSPRWIIPEKVRFALPVFQSWKPYNLKSRLQWEMVIAACRWGVFAYLPTVEKVKLSYDFSYWNQWIQELSYTWEILTHIGNPSHTQKAILFFIDHDCHIKAVAKLPLQAEAGGAILHEANILQKLQMKYNVPHVLFSDQEHGIAAQTWIEGKHVPRKFREEHLEFLTQLVCDGLTVRLSPYRSEIAAQLNGLDAPLDRDLLQRALALLDNETEFTAFIEHGDFAPWNMRQVKNGKIALIDWEWAMEKSLPYQDICRFFYIQDYLFRESRNVWEILTSHPLLQLYARQYNLSGKSLQSLTAYYLLRSLCRDWIDGNRERAIYTMRQLQFLFE